jgi:hypothetical protein
MCISTDFLAQYEHKAAFTRTFEHPPRSNMDVFAVTHSPRVNESGERRVTTDIWRIFSVAKGSALFHNQGLDDIVAYYSKSMEVSRVFVFSDGAAASTKGGRISFGWCSSRSILRVLVCGAPPTGGASNWCTNSLHFITSRAHTMRTGTGRMPSHLPLRREESEGSPSLDL